jgi:hypothetical protein
MPPRLPFGIGTKAINQYLIASSLYLNSRLRFVHFTLNQHNFETGRTRLRPRLLRVFLCSLHVGIVPLLVPVPGLCTPPAQAALRG